MVDIKRARMEAAIDRHEGNVKASLGPDGQVRFGGIPKAEAEAIKANLESTPEPAPNGKLELTLAELEEHRFAARVLERIEICEDLEEVANGCDEQMTANLAVSPQHASAWKIRAAIIRDTIEKIVTCAGRSPEEKARCGRA